MALTKLLRHQIEGRVAGAWRRVFGEGEVDEDRLVWSLRVTTMTKDIEPNSVPTLVLKASLLHACGLFPAQSKQNIHRSWITKLWQMGRGNSHLSEEDRVAVTRAQWHLHLHVPPHKLQQAVIATVLEQGDKYGSLGTEHMFARVVPNITKVERASTGHHLMVHCRLPHVTAPFTPHHLRVCAQAHFTASISSFLGARVTRVACLPDWGLRLGLAGVGHELQGSSAAVSLQDSPAQHLSEVYAWAEAQYRPAHRAWLLQQAAEAGALEDALGAPPRKPTRAQRQFEELGREEEAWLGEAAHSPVSQGAAAFLGQLEGGEGPVTAFWQECGHGVAAQHTHSLQEFGIQFDEIEHESAIFKRAGEMNADLKRRGLLLVDPASGVGSVEAPLCVDIRPGRDTPVSMPLSRNGQPLPLASLRTQGAVCVWYRDLAAFLMHQEKYGFDRIHYVDAKERKPHYEALVGLVKKTGRGAVPPPEGALHLAHGALGGEGASHATLGQLLDEATHSMLGAIEGRDLLGVREPAVLQHVARRLAVAVLTVQALAVPRRSDATFSWLSHASFSPDTGAFLQYTHARLARVESSCDYPLEELHAYTTDSPPYPLDHLTQPQVAVLLRHLARFDEVVQDACDLREPQVLIKYLFLLAHWSSVVLGSLDVVGLLPKYGMPRVAVVRCARTVLANGLRLLAITPLDLDDI